jgi:hypothetical protein
VSRAGTPYHVQIEDRGPVADPVLAKEVRRVNVIVYANYGEPNARIIHGRDHDFEDWRTQEHNRFVEGQIARLSLEAREIVEQKEARRVERIKLTIREYHQTKGDEAKKALEEANALFPFVFSRAWMELKQEKGRGTAAPSSAGPRPVPTPSPTGEAVRAPGAAPEATPETAEPAAGAEIVYPLDPVLRERVMEIERVMGELERDLAELRTRGSVDDILLQTCRKLMARARDSICSREGSDYATKRLEMTRNSLTTTWRQVQSRLR